MKGKTVKKTAEKTPQSKPADSQKTMRFTMRMTEEEKDILTAKANKEYTTPSQLLRKWINTIN